MASKKQKMLDAGFNPGPDDNDASIEYSKDDMT
jgi:hypothetical protein